MPDNRWTLEPEIDAYLEVIELPPDEFMQQLAAERAPIEAAAPKAGEAEKGAGFIFHKVQHQAELARDRPADPSPPLR
jgi:hypothetical protein